MKRNFSAVTETTLRVLGKDFDLYNDYAATSALSAVVFVTAPAIF